MIFKDNNSCINKCTHVSNNHYIQVFKIKFQNNFRPIAFFFFFFFFFFFSNYCIIANFTPVCSYINSSNTVIRGSNPCQNKKAYKELTLHSVREVKEFGQVTVE